MSTVIAGALLAGILFGPEDGSSIFLETLNKLKGRWKWKFKMQNVLLETESWIYVLRLSHMNGEN
jgi:hypothetical protein